MVRISTPTQCPPTHPEEMLVEEFLNPMELTQRELADAIRVPYFLDDNLLFRPGIQS